LQEVLGQLGLSEMRPRFFTPLLDGSGDT
jgi:hypothetical protein